MSDLAASSGPESLLLGNGQQLTLLPESADDIPDEAFAPSESRGFFTGHRLHAQNPRLYRAIAKLLGRGETFWTIADILQVSVNTVRAVREREGGAIDTEKTRIGGVALHVARLSFEALLERLSDPVQRAKLAAKDIAIIAGISTQNAQLLLGGATARIETMDTSAPGHDDYLRLLAAARELRNVTPVAATGLVGENRGLKEAAVPVVVVTDQGAAQGAIDHGEQQASEGSG